MDRRTFLVVIVFTCGCGQNETPKTSADGNGSTPSDSRQPYGVNEARAKVARAAVLTYGSRDSSSASAPSSAVALFRDRLTQLGYVQGKTLVVEEYYADGDPARLTRLAEDIVASKPDVIVTIAVAATTAARQA